MKQYFYILAWAWLIILGALMLTPDGISCIACGKILNIILGLASVAIGATGLILSRQNAKNAG